MNLPYQGNIKLTSPYGMRSDPFTGARTMHGGLDLVGQESKEIRAVTDGSVVRSRMVTDKSNTTWQWGNYVAVDCGGGIVIYYCHMSRRLVNVGQRVKAGDVLGIEGATGRATGSHCHFEVRRNGTAINAADYLGIENKVGYFGETVDYAKIVAQKCGFEQQTIDYLNQYTYAADLWRKLYLQMQ